MLIIQPPFSHTHSPALLTPQLSSETNFHWWDIISMSCISLQHSSNERCVCWKIGERQTLFKHTLASVLWALRVKSLLIIWRRVKGGMRHARTRVRERGGGVFRLPCLVLSFSTHVCSLTCIADVGKTSGVPWDIWLWSIRGKSWSSGNRELWWQRLLQLYGPMRCEMVKHLAGWTLRDFFAKILSSKTNVRNLYWMFP